MFENFINTKAKAFVVFLFSLASLFVFSLSTQAAVLISSKWYGIIAGVALMIAAIPFHIQGKKYSFLYVFSCLLNFIGCGFSASAYYLSKNLQANLLEMILAAIPSAAILFLIYLMLQIFAKTKRITLAIAAIINLVLLIAEIVCWVKIGGTLFSFGFFCLIVSLFFICVFGITINHNERPVLRDISYGSFGTFVILTVVVIVILSEGDILDGLGDGFVPDGSGKSKKKKAK